MYGNRSPLSINRPLFKNKKKLKKKKPPEFKYIAPNKQIKGINKNCLEIAHHCVYYHNCVLQH